MDQRDIATILRDPGPGVVRTLERDPLYFLGTQVIAIDLRSSATV